MQRRPAAPARLTIAPVAAIAVALLAGACSSGSGDVSPIDGAPGAGPVWILNEFSIGGDLVIAAGTTQVTVANLGLVEHNVGFEFADGGVGAFSSTLLTDETELFSFGDLAPGDYVLFCDIDGHRTSGMEATLTIQAQP